jgi:hypothetical protein
MFFNTLPGRREESKRAGITPKIFNFLPMPHLDCVIAKKEKTRRRADAPHLNGRQLIRRSGKTQKLPFRQAQGGF